VISFLSTDKNLGKNCGTMPMMNPNEYERMLASMFFNTKDRQYASKYSMGKIWVRGNEKAIEALEELKDELEEDMGANIIRLQHMSSMSNDSSSFFEMDDGRNVSIATLRERLDHFVFDIYEIVTATKSPMFHDSM
jgi:hypothetical protein